MSKDTRFVGLSHEQENEWREEQILDLGTSFLKGVLDVDCNACRPFVGVSPMQNEKNSTIQSHAFVSPILLTTQLTIEQFPNRPLERISNAEMEGSVA